MKTGIGWVYMLSNEAMPKLVKIGFTFDDPWERANQLSTATGVPMPFKVLSAKKTPYPREVEAWLHSHFRYDRVSDKEFFTLLDPSLKHFDDSTGIATLNTDEEQRDWLLRNFTYQIRLATAWQKVQFARQRFDRLKLQCGACLAPEPK